MKIVLWKLNLSKRVKRRLIAVTRIVSGQKFQGYLKLEIKPPDQYIWRCDSGTLDLC